MGCLNSDGSFKHWFGNIHLSGPCNRECYFCIGQHMMALDGYNNLSQWPLDGIEEFALKCKDRGVDTVYVTGTNTDPLLFRNPLKLRDWAKTNGFKLGIRTNAVKNTEAWQCFDAGSVTICSTNPETYRKMMGKGDPPDLEKVFANTEHFNPSLKVNIVLGPENTGKNAGDLHQTLLDLHRFQLERVNLREPYGQPHIGLDACKMNRPRFLKHGNPTGYLYGIRWTYWDVHYTEVESVNLYASGRVSETYPITKGHVESGIVRPQSEFNYGRHQEQWVSK